jgi:hypothetical protein
MHIFEKSFYEKKGQNFNDEFAYCFRRKIFYRLPALTTKTPKIKYFSGS